MRVLWTALLALGASVATPARAADPCATPRSAVEHWFAQLQPDAYAPAAAAACFEVPAGVVADRVPVQLKEVLDARGLYVAIRKLPDDPAYVDAQGEAVVLPVPELPVIAVVRGEDGRWRFSEHTVQALPELYADTFSAVSEWFQSNLPPVFYTRAFGVHLWQVTYAALQIAVAWTLGTLLRLILKQRVRQGLARLGLELDPETWRRTNGPLVALVALGVLYWGLPELQLPIQLSGPLRKVLWVGVWVAGVTLALRFVSVGAGLAGSWASRTDSKLDDQAIPLLRQASQLVLLVIGTLYIADAVGFDVWKLAAGVGIGGLAFALAAQDTVANVFGSVNIFLDRPFQIGDSVRINGVEGIVEEVGFRSTRVRTFHNSLVTIPNSQITSASVDNYGLRPRRRIKFVLGVTYDTPPDVIQAFVEGLRAVLAAHPKVHPSYEVHVHDFGASSIDVLVVYHVEAAGWTEELEARAQHVLEFLRLARALGVSFAFPSTSVYVESTPERPLAPREAPDAAALRETFDRFGPGGAAARPGGPDFGTTWSSRGRGALETPGGRPVPGGLTPPMSGRR